MNVAQGAGAQRGFHRIAQREAIRAGKGCACGFNPVFHHGSPRGTGVTRVEKESSHFNEWNSLSELEQRVITYWVDTTEQALFPQRWSPGQRRREEGRKSIFGALFCNRVRHLWPPCSNKAPKHGQTSQTREALMWTAAGKLHNNNTPWEGLKLWWISAIRFCISIREAGMFLKYSCKYPHSIENAFFFFCQFNRWSYKRWFAVARGWQLVVPLFSTLGAS